MIDGQGNRGFSAILAGKVVTAENFPFAEIHFRMGSMHHILQADDRWDRVGGGCGMNNSSAVHDQSSLISQHQSKSALDITHVYGFKIGVEDQYCVFHTNKKL